MLVLLILLTVVDLGLTVLLVAVSGFIFGSGPEGMNGETGAAATWTICFLGCLAGPAAGFMLRAKGRAGWGVLTAFAVPVVALLFFVM